MLYNFKGTVDSYGLLPKDNIESGDAYCVRTGNRVYEIRAGDTVVWNGNKWESVGNLLELTPYMKKNDPHIQRILLENDNLIIVDSSNETLSVNLSQDIRPATRNKVGGVIPGAYLEVSHQGKLDVNIPIASENNVGLMTPEDKERLGKVELPKATANQLGGIKLGQGLVSDDEGVVSVQVPRERIHGIKRATKKAVGGIIVGYNLDITEDGVLTANYPTASYYTHKNMEGKTTKISGTNGLLSWQDKFKIDCLFESVELKNFLNLTPEEIKKIVSDIPFSREEGTLIG